MPKICMPILFQSFLYLIDVYQDAIDAFPDGWCQSMVEIPLPAATIAMMSS